MDEHMIFLLILGGHNTETKSSILEVGIDYSEGIAWYSASWRQALYLRRIVVLS